MIESSNFRESQKKSVMRPSQEFGGFREKGYLFSGIWGEGPFIFRDLGSFWSFREQVAEEKHFRELGRKVIFLLGSREQRPPLGGASVMFGHFHSDN